MAHDGTIQQFPAPRWQGGGTIDSEAGEFTFSVRELMNGGPEHLDHGRQLKFDLVNGCAVRVLLCSVDAYTGTIESQTDGADNWLVKEDGTNHLIRMHYDRIFKGLPSIIGPGERVSYTRKAAGREAFNIRFPELVPLTGQITRYFESRGKGFVTPDGWNEDVIFHKAAFTNLPSIHVGMKVKFDLERACPMKLQRDGIHCIQATRMKVNADEIHEVEHGSPAVHIQGLPSDLGQNPEREPFVLEDSDLPDDNASHDSFEPMQLTRFTFSRKPGPLHEVLKGLMRESGGVKLPSGAYLIAPPIFHDLIGEGLAGEGLGRCDVMATPALAGAVSEAIDSLPRRYKISIQSCETIAVHVPPTWEELDEDVNDQEQTVEETQGEEVEEQVHAAEDAPGENQSSDTIIPYSLQVTRTFIQVLLPSSMFSAPSGGPRTQSDSASMITENPRTRVPRNRDLSIGVQTV